MMRTEELERLPRDADACFGSLATARGHLPLEAMDVHARAVGLDVRISLRQSFKNTLGEPIEATYIFPLPDRGAVTGFRLRVGERVVEGVIDERGQARQAYDDAIRAGHRAAIAEEERPDVFTVRVGNLMPGQRASIELDLVGALALERNEATFRFPLVVAPRYIPGVPLEGDSVGDGIASDTDAVPDASRITPPVLLPGYPNPVRLTLRVDIDPSGLPMSQLRSSLHAVVESDSGAGVRSVEVRPGARLDRDFILRWALGDGAVRTSLVVAPDRDGGGASFALTLLPPDVSGVSFEGPHRGGERPRDVVLVLDRSGSMGGWKMVAARRAAARLVDQLSEVDRFAVLAFDDQIDAPRGLPADALVAASDRHRFRAIEFLAGLEARGGTEMAEPLTRAAALLGGGYRDRERVLLLVTDGQVGNEDQILRALSPRLRGARVFSVGIDRAVNAGFLQRLGELGAGGFELVESEDRLDEVMDRVQRKIGTPVVTELSIAGEGLELEPATTMPARLPDLMQGTPVVIRGRLRGARREGSIALVGADRTGARWQAVVPARVVAAGGPEAALWARAAIRHAEDLYAAGGADSSLINRIVDISKRFSVLSRFTAFLAVDRSEKVNPGGKLHRTTQAVEPASGWGMLGAADEEMADEKAVSAVFSAQAFDAVTAAPAAMPAPPPAPRRSSISGYAPQAVMERARFAAAGPAAPAGGAAANQPKPVAKQELRREAKKKVAPPAADKPDAAALPPEPAPATRPVSLLDRLRELRDQLAARAAVDPVALALVLVQELDAIARGLSVELRAALDRVRMPLRDAAAGRDPEARLTEAMGELEALIRELEGGGGPSRRREAFWK
ncbi:MAG TPA: VIT domain-containing protein [Kofleriaceae bacterium]|nr:VIT domain-containing protein [Kofleriaceae bacterium]